jgi:hypothetical protein
MTLAILPALVPTLAPLPALATFAAYLALDTDPPLSPIRLCMIHPISVMREIVEITSNQK